MANVPLIVIPPGAKPVEQDNIRKINAFIQDVNKNYNKLNLNYNSASTVKVSANDSTADTLDDKLTAGTGITITENNDGNNETLTFAIGAHADLTDMPDTGGTNTDHDVRYVTKVQTATPTTPTPYEGMRWYDTDAIQGGYNINVTVITDTYIVISTDDLVVCNKTTAFTVTLPVASGGGRLVYIKNINTGSVTIDADSADTIDGITTQTLSQWDAITVCDYAANKWVIL